MDSHNRTHLYLKLGPRSINIPFPFPPWSPLKMSNCALGCTLFPSSSFSPPLVGPLPQPRFSPPFAVLPSRSLVDPKDTCNVATPPSSTAHPPIWERTSVMAILLFAFFLVFPIFLFLHHAVSTLFYHLLRHFSPSLLFAITVITCEVIKVSLPSLLIARTCFLVVFLLPQMMSPSQY